MKRVIKKYQDIIKKCPKNIRSCLGIPLESYLFCAGFESEIVHDFRNDSTVLDSPTTTVLSGVILMEKFLKYKLELFLEKHLKALTKLQFKQEHFLYVCTFLHIELLQTFAFKQAFNLDYTIIKNALSELYCDENVIRDLNDIGIFLVEFDEKKEEYHLKFNHATYQEYFAALKIISGLMRENINKDVEGIFKHYKQYDPAKQVIFQFAAQLSLSNSKFLTRLNQNPDLISERFWGALYGEVAQNSDLLKQAECNLVDHCISVLTESDKEH